MFAEIASHREVSRSRPGCDRVRRCVTYSYPRGARDATADDVTVLCRFLRRQFLRPRVHSGSLRAHPGALPMCVCASNPSMSNDVTRVWYAPCRLLPSTRCWRNGASCAKRSQRTGAPFRARRFPRCRPVWLTRCVRGEPGARFWAQEILRAVCDLEDQCCFLITEVRRPAARVCVVACDRVRRPP